MSAPVRTALTAAALLVALAGCAPAPAPAPQEPAGPEPGEQQPCQVGYWLLDVPDYATQSEEYLLGLGVPVEGFAMTGEGSLDIGADGFITGVVSLVSTGTIVAGEVRVPFETPSSYTFSGNWEPGDDPATIDLSNWATVPDPGVETDPEAPAAPPAIDFTDVPSVSTVCTGDSLSIQGPDAPLAALFHRE